MNRLKKCLGCPDFADFLDHSPLWAGEIVTIWARSAPFSLSIPYPSPRSTDTVKGTFIYDLLFVIPQEN